jgi:S1-C subfamily serine protease
MSTRGTVLLAIGMLVLGLLIGGLTGGAAGFFMGTGRAQIVGRNFPVQPQQPQQPTLPDRRQATPANPNTNPRGLPPASSVLGGATITQVDATGPASKAGLQVGDIITAIDSTKLDANHALADLIQAHKPGDKVNLAITRGTQTLTIPVDLGASSTDSTKAFLGIQYSTVPTNRRFPNG